MQVLMLNDLTPDGIDILADGLAYKYNIDKLNVDITLCSLPSNSDPMNVIMSIVVRFANKYTWN